MPGGGTTRNSGFCLVYRDSSITTSKFFPLSHSDLLPLLLALLLLLCIPFLLHFWFPLCPQLFLTQPVPACASSLLSQVLVNPVLTPSSCSRTSSLWLPVHFPPKAPLFHPHRIAEGGRCLWRLSRLIHSQLATQSTKPGCSSNPSLSLFFQSLGTSTQASLGSSPCPSSPALSLNVLSTEHMPKVLVPMPSTLQTAVFYGAHGSGKQLQFPRTQVMPLQESSSHFERGLDMGKALLFPCHQSCKRLALVPRPRCLSD